MATLPHHKLYTHLQSQSQDFSSTITQSRQSPEAALARKQEDPEVSSMLELYQHQRWHFPFQVLTCHVASPPEDLSSLLAPMRLIRNCSFSFQVLRHEHACIFLFKARLTYPGEKKLEAAWKAQLVWHLATHLRGERDRE